MKWQLLRKALKNRDIQRRFAIVIFILILFRILSHIPVPVGDAAVTRQLIESALGQQQLFGFFDLLSGGALANFSIMLLGLGPYINASIIMQILTRLWPKLKELQKEGESGQSKINQYTRMLSLPLAATQAIGSVFLIRQFVQSATGVDIIASATPYDWLTMVSVLTASSILLMWLGELISEQGIGNGITLIIVIGVLTQLPQILSAFLPAFTTEMGYLFKTPDLPWISTGLGFEFTTSLNLTAIFIFACFTIVTLLVTYYVVKLNEAQRPVTVSYAKRVRGNRAYGGVDTVLPLKLIVAGVMPVIFAVALLSVPNFVGSLLQNAGSERLQSIGQTLVLWFGQSGNAGLGQFGAPAATVWIYPLLYFLLVIGFSYGSAGLYFNAKDTAENLQKQGAFVGGIRPGAQTERYLKNIIYRLTFFGSFSLGVIAVLPFIVQHFTGSPQVTIGGTGLLIVVSGSVEMLRQIESKALMATYDEPSDLRALRL
jgi:preprotein translocase subunit SecY